MSRSTTPPGWPWMLASAVLVYVPPLLVEGVCWLIDQARAGDDNLADFGGDE